MSNKLIALTVVRNEEWVLEACLTHTLQWCDGAVLIDHRSEDHTPEIAWSFGDRVDYTRVDNDDWLEMDHRQLSLDIGRALGGTHFAIVDADELLTANAFQRVRDEVWRLTPRQCLSVPMICPWRTLQAYRADDCIWSRAKLTLAFCDAPGLCWKAQGGYHHHSRKPRGAAQQDRLLWDSKADGGVMHLQFANWQRLVAKHAWYKMQERLRWPRKPVHELERMYNQALDERGLSCEFVETGWFHGDCHETINLDSDNWQAKECRAMWDEHGPEAFNGLNLFGVVNNNE